MSWLENNRFRKTEKIELPEEIESLNIVQGRERVVGSILKEEWLNEEPEMRSIFLETLVWMDRHLKRGKLDRVGLQRKIRKKMKERNVWKRGNVETLSILMSSFTEDLVS